MGTEVKIGKLDIRSLKSITLKNLILKDRHLDTLFFGRQVSIRFSNLGYLKSKPLLESLRLDQVDFRLKKYKGEMTSNLTQILDYFKSADTTGRQKSPFQFNLKRLRIYQSHFSFNDYDEEKLQNQVDFKHIDLNAYEISADQLKINGDTVTADINEIALKEQSGFEVDDLSCRFTISPVYLIADSLHAVTPQNDLSMNLRFSYRDFSDYSNFVNKVKIEAEIRPSRMNLVEVGYFAPVMYNMDNAMKFSGDISGTVNNFKARDIKFAYGTTTQFRGNVQMNGLPDFNETFSHLSIDNFETTMQDISEFRVPSEVGVITFPAFADNFGNIRIRGKFTGFYNDFVSYASFNTSLGSIKTDLLLRVNKQNTVEYEGKLITSNFNAGKLFGVREYLHRLDLAVNINGSGLSFDKMNVRLEGTADSLEFYKNVYNEIQINGRLIDKKFTGSVDVIDDLGQLTFSGSVDYSENVPVYNFSADIKNALLDQINLIHRDSSSMLSTRLNINFMGNQLDNMQGIIIIDSTVYSEKGKTWFMRDFTLSITRDSTKYGFIRLYSDIIDATMEGQFTLVELPKNSESLINMYLDTLVSGIDTMRLKLNNQDFIYTITLKNTKPLCDLFVPDLKITPGASITGGFNSRINNLFFDGNADTIEYAGKKMVKWYSEFNIRDDYIHLLTGAGSVFLNDTLQTDSVKLLLAASNNSINYGLSWRNASGESFTKGDLDGKIKFLGQSRFRLNFDKADIVFSDTTWRVKPGNYLLVDTNSLYFKNIGFTSNSQNILFNGKISDSPSDTLTAEFNGFDLSNTDIFLQGHNIDMDGQIDGKAKLVNLYHNPFYLADLSITGFHFNREDLGDATLSSEWNSQEKALVINADFIYTGNIGQTKILEAKGNYYPYRKQDNFDIDLTFNKFRVNILQPLMESFTSDFEGLATGELKLTGSNKDPEVNGRLNLVHGHILIDYLNVKYSFANYIYFEKNKLYFNDMVIYDSLKNQASCSMELSHKGLKDFYLDLNLNTSNLWGLNTTSKDNSVFYGKAFAGGNIRIHGPFDDLQMDIDVTSERGTNIKIPIAYGANAETNDFIYFFNDKDKNEPGKADETIHVNQPTGMTLNLDLDVTTDADIQMFMPYQMGDLRTRGSGNIKMDIYPSGNMTMDGEYVIDRGSFFLTLQNIINRNFDIKKGSKVTWQGDPYDAKIDLKAIYKVKTTLGDYGPSADSSSRVSVDCIISLQNRLLDPEIRFTVEFPDLKEDTKQYIYARLDTNDQAMMSQQMISLLVLNSFYYPSGYSGSVGFNTFSLLTNQLNNWLSQISNDFDIGVNYRPGNELSAQEVEVALSTQLWEDRVSINGNVGVRGSQTSTTSQNTNNIVGEVTVEVKITPDGRFRAKAFNKSNNDILYKNYSPYTQGVGVFYTQEFNSLRDLFERRKEKNKKKNNPQDQTMLDKPDNEK